MLWTGLGMTVDNITAQQNFLEFMGSLKQLPKFLELQWHPDNSDPWGSYMQNRYGDAFEQNKDNIQHMWEYLLDNAGQPTFNADTAWKMIESKEPAPFTGR